MNFITNLTISILTIGSVAVASASEHEEYGKSIDFLGTQSPSGAHFALHGGLSTACRWGVIYLDLEKSAGRAAYGTLLAAKLVGKPLSRVNFTKDGDGMCNLQIVQVN